MAAPRRAAVRFKERSELLDFLLEVSTATAETLDLDRLLANVSDIVRKVIDYELFAILLYTERTRQLRIRYSIGHRPELVENLSVSMGEGITGSAAEAREPVLVGDVRNDSRYLRAVDAVRSELAVPMIARQRLVGVLDVQSTRLNAYTQYDRALMRLIASRVAFAIDNARLYRRADRSARTLRTLAAVSQEISSILDLDELLDHISRSVRKLIPYDAFSIYLLDEPNRRLTHRFSLRYNQRVKMDHMPLDRGITGAAARSREPIRVIDTRQDSRYVESHPDILSELAVPLMYQDRVIGVMDLESDKVGFFTEEHVRTLTLLAPQVANSIENARLYAEVADRERRLEADLKSASEVQALLLPREAPQMVGLELGVGLRPAREISGDFWDYFEHDADHVVLAFGDVSGKGVAAALFGAMLNGLLRTLAPRRRSPAVLLKALNDALAERKVEGRYVTLLVLLWHPHSHSFTMSNAGALAPLVIRRGELVKVRVEGVPVGLLEGREYEDTPFQAEPGDLIVLYSDGIADQVNAAGDEYGRRRLAQVVRTAGGLSAQQVAGAVFEDVDRFGSGARRFDDQTVLVIKVKEDGAESNI